MKEDSKLKKLEIIQGIIARMANNSFLIKGWSITILVGVLTFYTQKNNSTVLLLLAGALALFWFLDTYYLRAERMFRAYYEEESEKIYLGKKVNYSLKDVKNYSSLKLFTECFISLPTMGIYLLAITVCVSLYLYF